MKNSRNASTLQMFPWPSIVAAVKRSTSFSDFEAFYNDLPESLPQNSPATRLRVANLIVRAYFPGRSLNVLPTLVWRAYQREDVLVDVMRVMTLEAEPVIACFAREQVLALSPGDLFDPAVARDFVSAVYGGFQPKSYERLLTTVHHLGFLARRDQRWLVQAIPRPADAFLVLLHARLAPTPRIVRVSDILSATFWRHLGLRTADELRAILRDAEGAGLIARYVVVDELEQITTRYSFEEYLAKAVQL